MFKHHLQWCVLSGVVRYKKTVKTYQLQSCQVLH